MIKHQGRTDASFWCVRLWYPPTVTIANHRTTDLQVTVIEAPTSREITDIQRLHIIRHLTATGQHVARTMRIQNNVPYNERSPGAILGLHRPIYRRFTFWTSSTTRGGTRTLDIPKWPAPLATTLSSIRPDSFKPRMISMRTHDNFTQPAVVARRAKYPEVSKSAPRQTGNNGVMQIRNANTDKATRDPHHHRQVARSCQHKQSQAGCTISDGSGSASNKRRRDSNGEQGNDSNDETSDRDGQCYVCKAHAVWSLCLRHRRQPGGSAPRGHPCSARHAEVVFAT